VRELRCRGRRSGRVKISAVLIAFAIALLGGCGSSKSSSTATTTTAAQPATTAPTGGTFPLAGPIPESAAVDALTKDLTKPVAADIVAKCKTFVTAFEEPNGTGTAHAARVLAALERLAEAVRPIDPAVADALAGHAVGTVHWCKVKGFASS
jgi:hypothetical protein